MTWILLSPDALSLGINVDDFDQAVLAHFGITAERLDPIGEVLYEARIHPPGDHPYRITLFRDSMSASTDGIWRQAADFAAWIRSLLPADFPGRVWLVDQAYTGHAELPHGITGEEVRNGWLDHDIHGEPTDVR